MKMKKVMALCLAGVMAVGMIGCSTPGSEPATTAAAPAESKEEAAEGSESSEAAEGTETAEGGVKVFRYATNTEPTSLDSCKGNSVADNEINHLMQEGLVRNNCGEIAPGLAETWEIDETGTIYTFHLRDAKWPDGQPIVAGDFVYAFQRLADPATAAPYSWILQDRVKNATAVINGEADPSELGVSAPDDKTVVIELEYGQGYFLSLLGSVCEFTPQRKDIVEQYGEEYAADASKLMTYGPFNMISSADQQYIFEKNENYWDAEHINFDRIELSVIETGEAQLGMFEAGELDYVQIPKSNVVNYPESVPGEYVKGEYASGGLDWCYINTQADYVNNKNFRLALNYGLNRDMYISLAMKDVYTAWGNPVLPLVDGVEKTYGEEVQPAGYPTAGDNEKALEYLNLAMSEMGISNPSDITLEILTTDNETDKLVAEVLQELWQTSLGITVEIDQVTYSERYGVRFPNHEFMIGYGGWAPDYADPYTYLELFLSSNVYNYSQYSNPDFDALMLKSQETTDAKERLDILAQAEQILIDDGAVIPLQYRTEHYLIDEDVTGVGFYFIGYTIDLVYGDCAPTAE